MDRKKLVKELEDIKWELGGEDGDVAEAMENIVEVLTDYQVDTKDESWKSIVKDYYEVSQVKQSIIDLLNSSINCSADLLQKAVSSLSTCKYKSLWYKKVKEKFYDVTEKDVNELIDQLCKKYQSKREINKYKKEVINKIKDVDVGPCNNLEDKYEELLKISANYSAEISDPSLMNFCHHWFLTTQELRRELYSDIKDRVPVVAESNELTDDLIKARDKIKYCRFESNYYQRFSDGIFMDLNLEGLKWLKEQLLEMLGEKND